MSPKEPPGEKNLQRRIEIRQSSFSHNSSTVCINAAHGSGGGSLVVRHVFTPTHLDLMPAAFQVITAPEVSNGIEKRRINPHVA